VVRRQIPLIDQVPTAPDLVTCGVGSNDILHTSPRRVHPALSALIGRLPRNTVMLDLPLPNRFWGIGGVLTPHVARVNRTIHAEARAHELRIALLSRHFVPPWRGKFADDRFHPSALGYRDQAAAVLETILGTD
jgi:lysophospholipase L1-like esterase